MVEPTPDPLERTPARRRRLYVAGQAVGWGLWVAVNTGLLFAVGEVSVGGEVISRAPSLRDLVVNSVVGCLGLLLTHGYRWLIHRRRWVQLPWWALLPRVFAASLALAVVWIGLIWPLQQLIEGTDGQALPISRATLALVSVVNGAVVMFMWSALYFGYHLFERYRGSEIERWRLQSTVKEAELRALKSQVNPHFIFNALNSLRALIEENPAQARDAVTRLANLLRYSLKAGQLETVALQDELRVVEDYLALEQVRHEDRLRVRTEVAPEVVAVPVPPMLLQTLVENAVKYGIAPRREGGEIGIVARCVDGRMLLQVTNPGTLALPGGSTGVGLRNAADRLRLLFGDRARLSLTEASPGLVVATVELPTCEPKIPAPRHLCSVP